MMNPELLAVGITTALFAVPVALYAHKKITKLERKKDKPSFESTCNARCHAHILHSVRKQATNMLQIFAGEHREVTNWHVYRQAFAEHCCSTCDAASTCYFRTKKQSTGLVKLTSERVLREREMEAISLFKEDLKRKFVK